MKNFLFIITIIFSAMSCTNPKTIRIEGNIKGLPDGIIYLTDAYDASKIIDSTKAANGVFAFALTPLANTEPAEVSIRYFKAGVREMLTFDLISHMGLDGKVYGGSGAFILEEGVSKISGDLKGYSGHSMATLFLGDVNIMGGRQTDAYHQTIEFSGILHDTSKAVMERNAVVIKKYPYSFYLLRSLLQNRASYTNAQLQQMLGWFDGELQQSTSAKQLTAYIGLRKTTALSEALNHFALITPAGGREAITANDASLKVIVCWASWCGPCKMEIPALKKLYQQYGESIDMVSVSIDTDQTKWMKALKDENPGWKQLCTRSDQIDSLEAMLNFSGIPLVLFVKNNKELARFSGYEEGEFEKFERIIKINK